MTDVHSNPSYLVRPLPEALRGLGELALDLRWNWNHSADALWESIDPRLWAATGNAWLILESVSDDRLEALAADTGFLTELDRLLAQKHEYLTGPTWFSETYGRDRLPAVAYFSMEFGLGEALPIYSGGLGILAGDHLKTASDLGVPIVGVGLLYQQGYFRQALDADGEQLAFYPYNDPTMLPAQPLRDPDGQWLSVAVHLPGRDVHLRGWEVRVGRNRLYLLDSNHPLNSPADRGITAELYGGNRETRLQQEIILGIGGWRLLEALELRCPVCHLNEGHAALAVLERARSFMLEAELPFETALRCTLPGNVFTTHTPVEAAFDRYPIELVYRYGAYYAEGLGVNPERLLALGRARPGDANEPFNMAWLALRGSGTVNGVSRLHGQVSRRIFQPLFPRWPAAEVPVGHITNGVHMPSWDSAEADALWTEAGGKARWSGTMESLEADLRRVSDEVLWDFRTRSRRELLGHVRQRLSRQQVRGQARPNGRNVADLLDPNALTLGFARRFTAYKRPNLLLHDPDRMARILTDPHRPVQLIVAGKAHPRDDRGRAMIREWADFMGRPELAGRVVFVEDYAIGLAAELVQGVDVWINTPRRPWEACGTSGMKVLVNGGLNLSELDGWWAEAYDPAYGWALGDGGEHEPAWDAREAEMLYRLLEHDVVPLFFHRNRKGIPEGWIAKVRESMAHLTPRFSSNRMLREYTENYYLPAARAVGRRTRAGGRLGAELEAWRIALEQHWPQLHFGELEVEPQDGRYLFRVPVYLDELDPGAVRVELYCEAANRDGRTVWPMTRIEPLAGSANGFLYGAEVPARRPAGDYTPRIIPWHPEASVPLEARQILWYR